jgi:hypothetical protein
MDCPRLILQRRSMDVNRPLTVGKGVDVLKPPTASAIDVTA